MTRNHVFVTVGCGLVLLGLAELLGGGCGCTVHAPSMSWTSTAMKDGVELPFESKLHFSSPAKIARLALELESATIVVQGDPSVTGVEADYEVRERTAGDASLAGAPDGVEVKSASGSPVLVVSAKLRVPPGTEVDASTAFGAVTVSGIHGAASVAAKTDSGRVTLTDIANVPTVSGTSSFGDVSIAKGAAVGDVSLQTDSGAVSADDIADAKTVALKSSFGPVTAQSVNAAQSLTLETDSGAVGVAGVRTGRARLRSSFGAISAKRSTFDHLDAHTSSGGVNLKACKYKTKSVGTDFGGVEEEE